MTAAGLAATDVFLAATAALLLILAIAAPDQPQPLPIQADLLAICDSASEPPVLILRAAVPLADDEAEAGIALSGPADLADLPERLDLVPRLQYAVALVPDAAGALPMACVGYLRDGLVRPHNASLSRPEGRGPVYTLSVVPDAGAQR